MTLSRRILGRYWGILFCVLVATGQLHARDDFKVETAPEWDELFQRDNGWIGADGDFSVALSKNTTLWLFSDTFVGTVIDGKRTNAVMVNNSVAVQHGMERPEFYFGKNPEGKPVSFIVPQDGRGYFWIFGGLRARRELIFFAQQVESNGKSGAFGFHITGTWLVEAANPDDPPPQWKMTQEKIPFGDFSDRGETMFGSAMLRDHGYIYIYGVAKSYANGKTHALMIVARVPDNGLRDFNRWRFLADGEWVKDWRQVSRIETEVASEYSVSYLPELKKYAVVATSGLDGKITLAFGSSPVGPWAKAQVIYECPEQKWPGHNFCYAGKAHPELSNSGDELLISYAANSFNFSEVINDARLYWPRFVRVKIGTGR